MEDGVGTGPDCLVCGLPLGHSKKYQIHKHGNGYSLGGKMFILPDFSTDQEGHACHKCYQANLKAHKRAHPTEYTIDGMSPPPAKRPLRKIDAIRATLPPDYILLGVKALSNLASFATLACTECGGPWVHKSEQNTPTRSEITFMCHQNHTAKWCSDNNEKLAMADGEEGEGETAMENAAEQETDGEISGALRMNVID